MEEVNTMSDDKEKLELKNPTIHQKNENCQVFNGPISGCVFAMPGSTVNQDSIQRVVDGGQQTTESDEELVRRLAPFFKTEEEARRFPSRIIGMKNRDITKLVNQLWDKGVFADSTKPTDLWRVLHDLGYYTASDRNFCDQVTFTKRR